MKRRARNPSCPGLSPQVGFTRLAELNNAQLGQARVAMASTPFFLAAAKTWMAGTSPAKTERISNAPIGRREFITLLGAVAAAWPLAARAQRTDRMRRLGVVTDTAENNPEGRARVAALRQRLQELGWTEGRNLEVDYRWAGGDPDLARVYAAEILALNPDVIFALANAQLAPLARGTPTIPIVFVGVSDPVGPGYVASFAHPGGNITGFTLYEPSMGGKWVEMLKEIAPSLTRIAFMANPDTAVRRGTFYTPAFESAAATFAIQAVAAPVHSITDIESAIAALARTPNSGLIVSPDSFTQAHDKLIVTLASEHRLPAIYGNRSFPMIGGLLSYGPNFVDTVQRSASYIDRILRGDKPAELPVQAPTKFELVVNLKTAKALGLDVPLHFQQLADEVIE
jgi:putative ABC transport system substrate-binding protein